MESAWGTRKSTRVQGEGSASNVGGGSKLVQLQRQTSSTGPALPASTSTSTSTLPSTLGHLSHSSSSISSSNGPTISGGALDFGSSGSRSDSGHYHHIGNSSKLGHGVSGTQSGMSAVGAGAGGSGTGSGLGGSGAGTGAGAGGSGIITGTAAAAAGSVAATGASKTAAVTLTGSGSLHPLHFNWVFWFMHRAPGSKILNYESSMKKIATFGSVEDFWAVYSHLKRPHELPTVSDYHLFKQGVRPVWEDATNINGGKWIVRLKKGLASRYWEDLVMAVIGDQFDVGSEICGAVLSIRGGEDILSLWNQSAHEGRINLKIRDTMKKVLNLPADTIMEYKTHNDALKDNSSFRNTDVFR